MPLEGDDGGDDDDSSSNNRPRNAHSKKPNTA
jgi:hypothetical protein